MSSEVDYEYSEGSCDLCKMCLSEADCEYNLYIFKAGFTYS